MRNAVPIPGGFHCAICKHPRRQEIDELLIRGESARSIEKRFHVSDTTALRHKANHLVPVLSGAFEAREVAYGQGLADSIQGSVQGQLREMRRCVDEAGAILADAKQQKNPELALKAIRELSVSHREIRASLELLGRLTGELDQAPARNQVQVAILIPAPPKPDTAHDAIVIDTPSMPSGGDK